MYKTLCTFALHKNAIYKDANQTLDGICYISLFIFLVGQPIFVVYYIYYTVKILNIN